MNAHGDNATALLRASDITGTGPNPRNEFAELARQRSGAARQAVRPSWADLPVVTSGASPGTRGALLSAAILLICLAGAVSAGSAWAEVPEAAPVEAVELLTDAELETLVAPVALYPDDLLAIVLPASTFPLQVVLAARFLEAREADPDQEPDETWDASIVALLNYPEVLALLDRELNWTWQLGDAVLVQQEDVIAAVADFRSQASAAGNLETDDKQVVSVSEAGAIEITPVERELIYVPYYDPAEVVTYQPRRVYYYHPRPYPVYYYPYPSGHYFSSGAFWGVTSAFSIGWHSRSLHWHHRGFHDHPYFGYSYYDPFYYRRPHVWLTFTRDDRSRRHDRRHHDDNRWRNDDRYRGSRPGHRPDRRSVGYRPGAGATRSPSGRDQPEQPRAPAGRGIERNVVAMPGKRSGHVPVKRTTQPGASPQRRTDRTPARTSGTRRVASSARPQTPSAPTGQIRQRPAKNAASSQPPRISTPIRRPANVQRPAISTRPAAQQRPPRTTRPATVRQSARSAPPRVQQRQRPQAPSVGTRAAPSVRGTPPAVPRSAITSAIRRSAVKAVPPPVQSSRPRNTEPVAKRPPPVKPARAAQQRQAREPDRRRPKNLQ